MTATLQEQFDTLKIEVDAKSKIVDDMYYSGDDSEEAIEAYNEAAQAVNELIERLEHLELRLAKEAK